MAKKKNKKSNPTAAPPPPDTEQKEFAIAISESLGLIAIACTEDPPEPQSSTPADVNAEKGGEDTAAPTKINIPNGSPKSWVLSLKIEDRSQDIWKFGSGGKVNKYEPVPADKIGNANKVLDNVKKIRDYFATSKFSVAPDSVTIEVVSAYRSEEKNEAVNGAKQSQHMLAKALDFHMFVSVAQGTANPVLDGASSVVKTVDGKERRKVNPQFIHQTIGEMFKQKLITLGGYHAYPSGFNHYDVRGSVQEWKD